MIAKGKTFLVKNPSEQEIAEIPFPVRAAARFGLNTANLSPASGTVSPNLFRS